MPIPYRFINITSCNPPDKNKAELRRAVRSYVARVSAEPFKAKGPRSRGKNNRKVVVFDVNVDGLNSDQNRQVQPQPVQQRQSIPSTEIHYPSPSYQIGPNSVLPCSTTTVFRKPYMASILTNYVDNLCVRIPELDEHSVEPLTRTIWLPQILNTPVLFQVIALNAAIFYAVHLNQSAYAELAVELLWIKQNALSGLVQYLLRQNHQHPTLTNDTSTPSMSANAFTLSNPNQIGTTNAVPQPAGVAPLLSTPQPQPPLPNPNPTPTLSDDIIAATAKMAAFEAIYGDANDYHTHMAAVARMVRIRGGLSKLGLNGFLARMLVFIDTNSAALMGTNGRLHLAEFGDLKLPRRQFFVQMNQMKYLMYCGGGNIQDLEGKGGLGTVKRFIAEAGPGQVVPAAA